MMFGSSPNFYVLKNLRVDTMADRVFWINLPHRVDRAQKMANQLARLDIKAEGVDGLYGPELKVPKDFRATPGAFGCTLSHLALYAQALEQGLDAIAIFEDDCLFHPRFQFLFATFWSHIPADWQLAYLGGNHTHFGAKPPTPVNDFVGRVNKTLTTHAYLIRREAMKLALSAPSAYLDVIDVTLTWVQQRVPSYCAIPSLCTQAEGWSDCWNANVNYDFCLKGDVTAHAPGA